MDHFHGFRVLGRTVINDPAIITQLTRAYKRAAEESDGTVSGCFNPRHGFRIKHEGETVDFVVCFQCHSAWTYFGSTNQEPTEVVNISDSPQPVFDKILSDAGVPLAKKD